MLPNTWYTTAQHVVVLFEKVWLTTHSNYLDENVSVYVSNAAISYQMVRDGTTAVSEPARHVSYLLIKVCK